MSDPTTCLTIALASDEDRERLDRLAALDSSPPLTHPVLLGELDGACVAALSLHDGRFIGDPFTHTGDIATLLRTRASQLTVPRTRRPSMFRLGSRSWSTPSASSP